MPCWSLYCLKRPAFYNGTRESESVLGQACGHYGLGRCWGYNRLRAPVAQLDRASGFEPEGREFESLRARHLNSLPFTELANYLENYLKFRGARDGCEVLAQVSARRNVKGGEEEDSGAKNNGNLPMK